MRFELTQQMQAPLEAVEAAFVDPGFLIQLATLPKLGSPELLDQDDRGGQLRQRVRYAFAGELSSAVRRMIDPDRLTWVEDSTLDRGTHATTFQILPDYYSRLLEASGHITLESPDADGSMTIRRAVGDLVVHMPIVGHKVEAAIVSGMREHADLEVEVVERWVAGDR